MPTNVISIIKPKNNGTFPTHEDTDGYGGFQVRNDVTDRNSIPSGRRKQGMLVYLNSDGYFYQLAADLNTWNLANFGVSGGGPTIPNTRSITGATTIVNASDDMIFITTISAPFTITLPATPTAGHVFTIKDASGTASLNAVTLAGNGHTIDGSSTFPINQNYESINIVYNGTSWSII